MYIMIGQFSGLHFTVKPSKFRNTVKYRNLSFSP